MGIFCTLCNSTQQLIWRDICGKNIVAAPADSILGLTEAFRNDPNPQKVNLGVGVYKDDAGKTPILACVKEAERLLLEREITKSYLPISGDPVYAACVQKLIFGEGSEVVGSRRAATIHAPGGTGALRVGADLLHKFIAGRQGLAQPSDLGQPQGGLRHCRLFAG